MSLISFHCEIMGYLELTCQYPLRYAYSMKEKVSRNARRRLLFGLATLGTGLSVSRRGLGQSRLQSLEQEKMLSAIVDTVVPADHTPGALDAKIDKLVSKRMQELGDFEKQMLRLSSMVSKASLAKYRRDFYKLSLGQRELILNALLALGAPKIVRADLKKLRQFVLTEFYHSKEGRESINYVLPSHYPTYR